MSGPRPGPERGQSTVELALVLPVVVLLLLVLLQVGLVARDVVLVAHAAREGARAAAVDPDPGAAREAVGGRPPAWTRTGSRCAPRAGPGPGAGCGCEVAYRIPTNVPVIGHMLGDRTAAKCCHHACRSPVNTEFGHLGCKGYYTLGLPLGGSVMTSSGHPTA